MDDSNTPGVLRWSAKTLFGAGSEQTFVLERASGEVPGIVWLPESAGSLPPVVLLGHGGSSHKRSARVVELAGWLVNTAGFAALAIDGPFHGDRVESPLSTAEYQERIAIAGADAVLERVVGDWLATIAAIGAEGIVNTDRLGYVGVSMATRYGIPLAAATGARMKAAVFGKFGFETTANLPPSMDTSVRIRRDAPRVLAPTLFHLQWDDDHYQRASQLELFDLLGAEDKHLIAYPGRHNVAAFDAVDEWLRFIASRLGAEHRDQPDPQK